MFSKFYQKPNRLDQATRFKNQGQYQKAIENLCHIRHWNRSKSVLLCMASCFELLEEYQSAMRTYLIIPRSQRSEEIHLAIERCRQLSVTKRENTIYSNERNGPITFFKRYDLKLRKGITYCTYEKAYQIENVEPNISEYLKKHQIYIPHLEALDLAVSTKSNKARSRGATGPSNQ